MARNLAFTLLLVSACSGETAGIVAYSGPASSDSVPQGSGFSANQRVGEQETTETPSDAAAPDVDSSTSSSDDAGPDASSTPDTGSAEDASTKSDASDPPPPPPVCSEGEDRCVDYKHEVCESNAWTQPVGDQSCCHDPRFSVSGTVVTDSTTGKKWYRNGGQTAYSGAAKLCDAVIPNGRLPTVAEIMDILIAPGTCSPAMDQRAFQNLYDGDTWASDGCVNLAKGISKPACVGGTAGLLCIEN